MPGLGNAVFVSHGFDLTTRYGHLAKVLVEPGQRVEEGELLGIVHAQDEAAVEVGRRALLTSVLIGDGDPPEALPLIVDRIAAL